MRVNRGLLGWGVFFIALGGVPLAVRGGALDPGTARRAWELWPLLLIGAGLGLALRDTVLEALGGIVAALTFGLMAGGLLAGGLAPGSSMALCGVGSTGPNPSPVPGITGTLQPGATVDVSVACGQLAVVPGSGSDWGLTWRAGDRAPDVITSRSDRLQVRLGDQHSFGVGQQTPTWGLTLPADPALDLSLEVNAGSARLALGGLHVSSVSASVNAGDARLDLGGALGTTSVTGSANAGSLAVTLPPPEGTLTGSLSASAGTVRLCAPAGVPLRIRVGDLPLGATNLSERGLVQNGDVWTRGSWDAAVSRIDLSVSANLGTITLDPEDGCG